MQACKSGQPPTADLSAAPARHSAGGKVRIQRRVPPKAVQAGGNVCSARGQLHATKHAGRRLRVSLCDKSLLELYHLFVERCCNLAPSHQCTVRSHQPAPGVPCWQLTSYPRTSTLWEAIRGCRAARSPGLPWYCSGCSRSVRTNLEISWTQCPTRVEGHTMTEGCRGRPAACCSATEAAGQGVLAIDSWSRPVQEGHMRTRGWLHDALPQEAVSQVRSSLVSLPGHAS